MNRRKRVWFEETNSKLDPGLVEQLRTMRKNAYHTSGTQAAEIPIIIKCKKDSGEDEKEALFQKCNRDCLLYTSPSPRD